MKKILILSVFIVSGSIYKYTAAQENDDIQKLSNKVRQLEITNNKLDKQLKSTENILDNNFSAAIQGIQALQSDLKETRIDIQNLNLEFNSRINEADNKASLGLSNLHSLWLGYMALGGAAALIILLFPFLLFLRLKKQLIKEKAFLSELIRKNTTALRDDLQEQIRRSSETLRYDLTNLIRKNSEGLRDDLIVNINKTTDLLQEEQLKLDEQLIELLDIQLHLVKENKQKNLSGPKEIDHTLALKIVDAIVHVEENLLGFVEKGKGANIYKAIERIRENLSATGYEIIQSGTLSEGMGLVSSQGLPEGDLKQEGLKAVKHIKPQVNFKGELIQEAQLDLIT